MTYQVRSENDEPLDAHLEIQGPDIRYYSRSGATGTPAARNADYSVGLRAVLRQLRQAGVSVTEAYVDSGAVQMMPLADRRILSSEDAGADPEEQFQRLSQRMRRVGRDDDRPGGNNTKLIRLRTDSSAEGLKAVLKISSAEVNLRSANRIPDGQFRVVRAHHVWEAVQRLRLRSSWEPYSRSKDYDVLLDDGTRLPPKAVFGEAASRALGFPVLPIHFSGGVGTPCFQKIDEAGYSIVPKSGHQPQNRLPQTDEDRWAEGDRKLRTHIHKERGSGLSQAKKSAFASAHNGRLFCEICGFEPAEVHAADPCASACIEVHHAVIMVSEMEAGHSTQLSDLQCLCANCHRLVHARLRAAGQVSEPRDD
jgi:5-methylcytosine-specific restriction protein A